jgi:rhodanese-related sulfurtransferase
VFVFIALILSILVACTPSPTSNTPSPTLSKNSEGYTDISVQALAAMLPTKDFTLVNVHIPYEGEIPQTDAFIPFDEIEAHLDELPAKDAPIVLYCRSGNMSTTAAETLVGLGYTNVMEVDGGFVEWEKQGNELL